MFQSKVYHNWPRLRFSSTMMHIKVKDLFKAEETLKVQQWFKYFKKITNFCQDGTTL